MELYRLLRPIDQEIVHFVSRHGGSEELQTAAAIASYMLGKGSSCVDFSTLTEREIHEDLTSLFAPKSREQWLQDLARSLAHAPDTVRPLFVLCGTRFYLKRYYLYESKIVERLVQSYKGVCEPQFSEREQETLAALFGSSDDFSRFGGDLQLAGTILPLFFPISILSGGPGTGKTTTVAKLLALQFTVNQSYRVTLCAPTGKAAQRMNESLRANCARLTGISESCRERIAAIEASTIHRTLGVIPHKSGFRFNRDNQIPTDLVIIDEASMIDLPLLAKLFEAIPFDAKIILLGDQYQLSSVEAGSVLGDICASFPANQFNSRFAAVHSKFCSEQNRVEVATTLSPVIQLQRSFRFSPDGGIGLVSRRINSGEWAIADELKSFDEEIVLRDEIPLSEMAELFAPLQAAKSPQQALESLTGGIILTVTNGGTYGQENINRALRTHFTPSRKEFPPIMPILITENNYSLSLFNGDIGVLFSGGEKNLAYFFSSDPNDPAIRAVPIQLLPSWQPSYAITIHKSQGSEYGSLVILCGDRPTPLLTRELLYTAITRAKPIPGKERESVKIQGSREIIREAIRANVIRSSGIQQEIVAKVACTSQLLQETNSEHLNN